MRNRKLILIMLAVAILCICMCLSACGKNNKTANAKDSKTTSQDQTGDKKKDTVSGKNMLKDSAQEQNQPKIVYQENGSGVETIGTSDQIGQATQNPTSEKTIEIKHQEGVESAGEQGKTSESKEPTPAKQLSTSAQEYANYCAMSTEEQYAYYKKFESADEFLNWYNAAKAEYDKENQAIVLEPGEVIDIGN